MKRFFSILPVLALLVVMSLPARAQFRQKGWWVLDNVKIINQSTNPNRTHTPTSMSYRNKHTYTYIDNRPKKGDGKEHTITDVVTIDMSWDSPPPQIDVNKEGEVAIGYTVYSSPDLYKDEDFANMRPAPGYSMDMKIKLVNTKNQSKYFSLPEWRYESGKMNWGKDSGTLVLYMAPEQYMFSGIDLSDGNWQLVVRIEASCGHQNLDAKYDDAAHGYGVYVIENYYHYSTTPFSLTTPGKTTTKQGKTSLEEALESGSIISLDD